MSKQLKLSALLLAVIAAPLFVALNPVKLATSTVKNDVSGPNLAATYLSKEQATSRLAENGGNTTVSDLVATAPKSSFNSEKSPYSERILSESEFIVGNIRYPLRKYKALATPNDPSYSQWSVAQTNLTGAWDYSSGSGKIIAIVDSGISFNHEEFAGRWLESSGESGTATSEAPSDLNCTDRSLAVSKSCNNIDDNQDGINDNETGVTSVENPSRLNCTGRQLPLDKSCNLVDDDGNGFIDDFRGWDFDSGDMVPQAGEINPNGSGASHATSVAGVAAASGNNGVGIAGVSWGAKILPLQALSDGGTGDTLSVARAIRYAADKGADVINLSLGSDEEDSYLRSAIRYALDRGSIVVAASGNDGCDCVSYPARYPETVAVGASKSDGTTASFSSFGASLDIIAPGNGVRAPVWSSSNGATGYSSNLAGTSFATPFISGLLANAKASQPNASWGQIIGAITQTADHKGMVATSPRSNTLGFGFVNAGGFMARLGSPYNQLVRYSFSTPALDNLDATAHQCEAGEYPGAPFFEISKDGMTNYSASNLGAERQKEAGATVTQRGFTCTGLPNDTAGYLRVIDPRREFLNLNPKY